MTHSKVHNRSTIDWTVDEIITEKQAKEIQTNDGYHPNGYSFFNFKINTYSTTWSCYNSCE